MAMRALMLEPLTSAVCPLTEFIAMFHELNEAQKDYIAELN